MKMFLTRKQCVFALVFGLVTLSILWQDTWPFGGFITFAAIVSFGYYVFKFTNPSAWLGTLLTDNNETSITIVVRGKGVETIRELQKKTGENDVTKLIQAVMSAGDLALSYTYDGYSFECCSPQGESFEVDFSLPQRGVISNVEGQNAPKVVFHREDNVIFVRNWIEKDSSDSEEDGES